MRIELNTYYLINKGGRYQSICLIHYSSNYGAAEKAMMELYGLVRTDIVTTCCSVKPPAFARGNSCQTFDGRNSH